MRLSRMLLPTLREAPRDAEIDSHVLMMRAGIMRKLGSGLYTLLPLGLKALQNVIAIVREEMNNAGAQEILPPILMPADLWKETGRFQVMGREMFRLTDRHDNEMVLGPTHEEAFTATVRENAKSYRDLPLNLYQINTKFRDEIRPRFGVMRCREFIMKDAYSFDMDEAGLSANYQAMRTAYRNIFKRCGLDVSPVQADSGSMGGSDSEEFMVPSKVGEEEILKCPDSGCGYVANSERAVSGLKFPGQPETADKPEEVKTPDVKTIDELTAFFKTTPDRFLKTLVYRADGEPVLAVVRGDFDVNEVKLKNALKCSELELAGEETVLKVTGAPAGFVSPVGLNLKTVADESVFSVANGIAGANKQDIHFKNVNPERDWKTAIRADIRTVKPGEPCPKCGKPLDSYRGIEVGHIFKLGYKYTSAMNVKVLDKDGKEVTPIMGCYGIGVGRTLASVIEQCHDDNGVVWPMSVAPYQVIVTPVNVQDAAQMKAAEDLYSELKKKYAVLLDDRDERPGVKFKDADLIGIPIRVTVGKSLQTDGKIEIKERAKADKELAAPDMVVRRIGEIYETEMARFRA